MITKTISLYTEIEKSFLEKCLDLLQLEFTKTDVAGSVSHVGYTITATIKQFALLTRLLEYNYTENIIK